MIQVSSYLFLGAFAAYVASAILYVTRLTLRRRDPRYFDLADRLGRHGYHAAVAGVILQGLAIVARWMGSGQVPLANMFEYMSFLGWSIMLFFVILSAWYKLPGLGAFVAPVGVVVIAYASVFPTEVRPLAPVLQSVWLPLHVSVAALGEGAFAVSFGAALMYLLRVRKEQSSRWEEMGLEFFFFCGAMLTAFIVLALGFKLSGYRAAVTNLAGGTTVLEYTLPPFIGPLGSTQGEASFLGLQLPLVHAPTWMRGAYAARNLNTLVLSTLFGVILYGILRLIARGPLRELGTRAVGNMNPKLLDEVSYRGIAVGFPLFTLGGLVFAMIWAQKAWGRYWAWDPKETWALITWLFYSGYLHMRIVRGWEGRAAAWVSALGFIIVLFTLVGVNLLVSGLHSYV
ncbi:c-type cytochrome biogenesis protein CcsB [Symbiobacterium thermophilum]|uniref:Cytochrome c assembly protein domain-containing protein n=1 Tax=Symbiobacterium thermophilum TaxID=2734 RepID=A0A1Y2T6V5_SYMTR|nr:MAG: hypothetical protein A6D92_06100 [Symbiobacterium thermophilum]